jgi:hypothetical protein
VERSEKRRGGASSSAPPAKKGATRAKKSVAKRDTPPKEGNAAQRGHATLAPAIALQANPAPLIGGGVGPSLSNAAAELEGLKADVFDFFSNMRGNKDDATGGVEEDALSALDVETSMNETVDPEKAKKVFRFFRKHQDRLIPEKVKKAMGKDRDLFPPSPLMLSAVDMKANLQKAGFTTVGYPLLSSISKLNQNHEWIRDDEQRVKALKQKFQLKNVAHTWKLNFEEPSVTYDTERRLPAKKVRRGDVKLPDETQKKWDALERELGKPLGFLPVSVVFEKPDVEALRSIHGFEVKEDLGYLNGKRHDVVEAVMKRPYGTQKLSWTLGGTRAKPIIKSSLVVIELLGDEFQYLPLYDDKAVIRAKRTFGTNDINADA